MNILRNAGIIQITSIPQARKIKETVVLVDIGTEDNPFMVSSEVKGFMEQFEQETGKNAFWNNKITQNYLKWKNKNIIG